mmetsp:Transcript_1067/g.3316  ORF Transcript_1067/g.3316 Transcript_1067/m.3316 type:complete len:273 (-) Transcript_1067:1990-2808(-)
MLRLPQDVHGAGLCGGKLVEEGGNPDPLACVADNMQFRAPRLAGSSSTSPLALVPVEEADGQPFGEASGTEKLRKGKERQGRPEVFRSPAPLELGGGVVLRILRIHRAGVAVSGMIQRFHSLHARAVKRKRSTERQEDKLLLSIPVLVRHRRDPVQPRAQRREVVHRFLLRPGDSTVRRALRRPGPAHGVGSALEASRGSRIRGELSLLAQGAASGTGGARESLGARQAVCLKSSAEESCRTRQAVQSSSLRHTREGDVEDPRSVQVSACQG